MNALVKKLTSIQYLETYHALACKDGGMIGQFLSTPQWLLQVQKY